MGRKLGTSGRIMRRKELRTREQTDAQLLASAKRSAEAWQRKLKKGVLHSN